MTFTTFAGTIYANVNLMSERELIRILNSDIDRGFRILLREYRNRIYWHIRRITINHEDAQDATQETFIRIYRNYKQFNSEKSLNGWIFRIATNEAIRLLDKRKESLGIDGCSDVWEQLSDQYADRSDRDAVLLQKAIISLPHKQMLTFCLRYYEELSFEDIADVTDSTPSGAKANYHQAKNKIIRQLQDE